MIRIDSITLAISHDKVDINHLDMFKASHNGLILNPNIIGFNQIQLLTNIVRLHISSKILLEQYGAVENLVYEKIRDKHDKQ
jgi:hemerythrin superfamily protein